MRHYFVRIQFKKGYSLGQHYVIPTNSVVSRNLRHPFGRLIRSLSKNKKETVNFCVIFMQLTICFISLMASAFFVEFVTAVFCTLDCLKIIEFSLCKCRHMTTQWNWKQTSCLKSQVKFRFFSAISSATATLC